MYFVYQKTINVASDYYNPKTILQWFKNYIDITDYQDMYGDKTTGKDIVDEIFYNYENWIDKFCIAFTLDKDLIDNAFMDEIVEQIKEAIKDKLEDHYNKVLKELKDEEC